MICGAGGSKSRLAKAAGAETSGQMRDEQLHAVVARSYKVESDHFWNFRVSRAKHISKLKCTKHTTFGALLEVEMLKKCTQLWREAHFQVKMLKTPHARTTFEDLDVLLLGRCKGFCTLPKVSKM